MARILMVNLPLAGHTNPTLPLTRALVEQGHVVSYVNAEEYRSRIENTGAVFIPYTNYPDSPSEEQKARRMFRAAYDTTVGLRQRFDLLIYEMFFYPGIDIASRLKVNAVRQFAQPAWPKNTMVKASPSFRLTSRLIDYKVMSRKDRAHMGQTGRTMSEAIMHDQPVLNIVYVPRFFQTQSQEFGADFLFNVPLNSDVSVGSSHAQVIDYAKMTSPIIYISLGSIADKRGFYKECIRTFANRNLSVILNTGRVNPKALGNLPDNIHAYSFVPQIEVLQHSDVFLTHSGMNSITEAMIHGVPMVTMPLSGDQPANARRVVELGIGKQLHRSSRSGRRLYETVMDVYGDAQIRRRVAEVQGLMSNETPLAEVVSRIERLL